MRTGVIVHVSPADRERLAAIALDRNSPQKHAWWARIVLLTGEGCGTAEIMREAGVAKTAVLGSFRSLSAAAVHPRMFNCVDPYLAEQVSYRTEETSP